MGRDERLSLKVRYGDYQGADILKAVETPRRFFATPMRKSVRTPIPAPAIAQ